MRLRIPQPALQQATSIVSSLAGRASTPMPVVNNVLVTAHNGLVQVIGTDLESQVTVNVAASIEAEGRTTLDAARLADIVRLLPSDSEIEIEASGGRATVITESNEYRLMTLPAEDFPEWPVEPIVTKFRLEQKTLRELLDATIYALPPKDVRRILLGTLYELRDNMLRLTATDGKKLARVSAPVPEIDGKGGASLVVPGKLQADLKKLLGDQGPVDIEVAARQITFRVNNVVYRTQSIEGKYPDCDAVIPKEFPLEVRLNRDRFLSAAKRAGVVTDDQNKTIVLKFAANSCQFTSSAYDVGNFNGKVGLEYSHAPIELAFNFEFLVETLGCFREPELTMRIKSRTAPVVFVSDKEPLRLALLMPIKQAAPPPDEAGAGGAPEDEQE